MDRFVAIAYEFEGEKFEIGVNMRYFKRAYFKGELLLVMEFADFTILHQAKKPFSLSYLFDCLLFGDNGKRIALRTLED